MRLLTGLAVSAVLVAAGCAAGPQPAHSITVQNGTTLAVTVAVNGQAVAVFAPGQEQPAVDFSALPPRPWVVEARSPSGRVLASMRVNPGDGVPGVGGATTQPMAEAHLSCGWVLMFLGDSPPPGAPPQGTPSTFAPGDCAS